MPPPLRGLVISLPIADRRRAMAFYRDALGFEAVGTPAEDGVPEPLRFQLDGRTLLMLIPADGLGWVLGGREIASPAVSECLMSMSVAAEADVDTVLERVRKAGGEILTEAEHKEWGYSGICTDLDGHVWEILVEPPGAP